MGHHTPDRTSVDFSDLPAPIRTYHSGITVLLAVSSLRNSDRTCLYLRLRRNKSSLRCPPALENRIPDRTFRLLLHHIYTSSLLLALSSAPASLNHTPDRIFLAPLFRRNRSMYHPVAVPALPAWSCLRLRCCRGCCCPIANRFWAFMPPIPPAFIAIPFP